MTNAVAAAIYPKILQLIILPTEKCNFRCTYCYETFEIGKMKRETIDGIKNLISARANSGTLESLALSWFGGEPLLAKSVVEEISEHAYSLHQQGLIKHLNGDFTTNAYMLTVDVLQKMADLNQRAYQVSLDGYGDAHDKTRKYASGAGTFDTIWKNLLAAQKSDIEFRITLRLHLTNDNLESMEVLVDKIADVFGGDNRFDVFFKTIENLGGPNAAEIKKVDSNFAAQIVEKLSAKLMEAGLSTTAVLDGPESASGLTVSAGTTLNEAEERVRQDLPNEQPQEKSRFHFEGYICYASKPNSLVIRADGSVAKCTVLFEDPRNRVGYLNSDGTVRLNAELINDVWMRGFNSMDPAELGCPAQNLGPLPEVDSKTSVIKFDDLKQQR